MDVIQTGVSAADRTARAQLATKLRELLEGRSGNGGAGNQNQQGARIADLVEELGAAAGVAVSERDVQAALAELQGEVRVTAGRVTLARG
ncbi:hypothetical protein KSW81_004133 [Nannochloris sp. 'desiccata']|nr:hypothetical protein KSW81_004133 [Chlorella desiccata (nom. nud.)]